jgi:hypothetical protein
MAVSVWFWRGSVNPVSSDLSSAMSGYTNVRSLSQQVQMFVILILGVHGMCFNASRFHLISFSFCIHFQFCHIWIYKEKVHAHFKLIQLSHYQNLAKLPFGVKM